MVVQSNTDDGHAVGIEANREFFHVNFSWHMLYTPRARRDKYTICGCRHQIIAIFRAADKFCELAIMVFYMSPLLSFQCQSR